MNVIFAPKPEGAGTHYAESFLSVLQRTSEIYDIRLSGLTRFLLAMSPTKKSIKSISSQIPFLDHSDTTITLVTQFERLVGSGVYRHHTLLKLRHILSRTGSPLSTRYQWCPECLHPERGIGYSMLAHQMWQITFCPLHGCLLRTRCVLCARPIRFSNMRLGKPYCPSCGAALWKGTTQWVTESDAYTKKLLDVIAYVTNPDLPGPSLTWLDEVYESLDALLRRSSWIYEGVEIRALRERVKVPGTKFELGTLLGLISTQMLSPSDLFMAPKESLSARLPKMGVAPPKQHKPRNRNTRPLDMWYALKRTALELCKLEEGQVLPAWSAVCALVDVSANGFWQHFPEVMAAYGAERIKRLKGKKHRAYTRRFAEIYSLHQSSSKQSISRTLAPENAFDEARVIIEKHLAPWMQLREGR